MPTNPERGNELLAESYPEHDDGLDDDISNISFDPD